MAFGRRYLFYPGYLVIYCRKVFKGREKKAKCLILRVDLERLSGDLKMLSFFS